MPDELPEGSRMAICVLRTGGYYCMTWRNGPDSAACSLQPAACSAFLGEIQERKLVVMEGHSRVIILGDVHV